MGAAEQPDQSMEEILQSIKRIISEEGDEEAEVTAAAETEEAAEPAAAEEPAEEAKEPVEGPTEASDEGGDDDVLELTEIVNDDGTISKAKEPAEEAEEPVEEQAEAPTDEAVPMPKAEEAEEFIMADDGNGLLSEDAAKASSGALEELLKEDDSAPEPEPVPTTPSPAFRSGGTVEDLVMEALRPMLKEWLDGNLPQITERLVKDEIKRISPK